MHPRNIPFRIETAIVRSAYRAAGLRPASTPYVSGDGFRSLCRLRYEGKTRAVFRAANVGEGELVYCEAWHLREFLGGIARQVPHRFSILSHNGDPVVDESILEILPPNVHRLLAQNAILSNDRVVPVPIGLENKCLHCNGVTADFDRLRNRPPEKRPRILTAFTAENNPAVRGRALAQLSRSSLNDTVQRLNSRAYRALAATYMFVASPPGNGVDCHRTWEAMYLGAVPIVMRSALTERFRSVGLPLCIVDSYEEVAAWNEEALRATFEALRTDDCDALWFDYWKNVAHASAARV